MTEELLRKSLSRCPLFGGLSRETLDSLTGDDRAVRTYTAVSYTHLTLPTTDVV